MAETKELMKPIEQRSVQGLKIFAGNAHPRLASRIASYLGVDLGRMTSTKFADGEIRIMVDEFIRLHLDRKLAEKRVFPAIDVQRSGTRREELLLEEGTLKMVWTMRRMLSAVGTNEGIELLLNRLAKSQSNAEFLASLTKAGSVEA